MSRQKLVLVVDSDRMFRDLTARSVFATGVTVEAVEGKEQATARLKAGGCDLLYVDLGNVDLIRIGLQHNPGLRTVLMTNHCLFEKNGGDLADVPLSTLFVTSFLARSDVHDPITAREIVATTSKLLVDDIFGLEKYLSWGTAIRSADVTHSDQRGPVVDDLAAYAQECGLRRKHAQQLRTLAHELITNAIWDAPVDPQGTAKYQQQSRQQPIQLLPNETVTVRYGFDGIGFGLSVNDSFGRLEYKGVVANLARCFAKKEDQISWETQGAGLGLYMAYNTVSSFVINVAPQARTEVIGLVYTSRLDPGKQPLVARSFCYFHSSAPGAGASEARIAQPLP